MCDISELAGIVFSGLSSLVIEDVTDPDGVIVVRARTAGGPVPCPRCGGRTGQVHGYYQRTVADVPADGRPVVVRVRVRRMRCPVAGCPVQTFREQVPGVLDRYQRRTTRLAGQAGEVARRLARPGRGRAAGLYRFKLITWRLTWGLCDQLRRLVVLVDHATEDLAPSDRQVQRRAGLAVLVGRSLLAGLVRAVAVVMAGVLAED